MDKLRALQYLNRCVEAGSFAAAAKSFDVSPPAVAQLIRALERSVGATLFHRTSRGLSLTVDGERYYATSRKITAELHDVEQSIGPSNLKLRGTLTVGMRESVAHNCVMPRIGRFIARFPDVEVIVKPARLIKDVDAEKLDVAVLVGWPTDRDLAVRSLTQTRYIVCAAPEYWRRQGRPSDPEELREHHCLLFRSSSEIFLDRWIFMRGAERRTVDVTSRLFSADRPWLDEAACAGAGVIRLADVTGSHYVSSGLLVPVLTDWESLEAPTIYAAYRRSQRQSKLVRAFVDFLIEIFAELDSERMAGVSSDTPHVRKPEWFGRAHGRQSAFATRASKSRKI